MTRSNIPSDHDPEALLRPRLRATTPEFERRWLDLKRELRSAPAPRRNPRWHGWAWVVAPLAAGAAAALFLIPLRRPPAPAVPDPSAPKYAAYEDLFRLDEALRSALPLSDSANLDDLNAVSGQVRDPS